MFGGVWGGVGGGGFGVLLGVGAGALGAPEAAAVAGITWVAGCYGLVRHLYRRSVRRRCAQLKRLIERLASYAEEANRNSP